jgi:hypothetical protein
MAIETDDDALFIVEKIRDGTLTGDRKEAAFSALQAFRSRDARDVTREQRLARIAELEAEQAALSEDQPGFIQGAAEIAGGAISDLRGIPEAATQLVTGGAATAVGGAAAIPITAFEAFRGGEDPAGAGRAVIEEFQDRFTFEPRTEVGQRASEAIAAPLESLEQAADRFAAPRDVQPTTGEPQLGDPIRVGDPVFDALRKQNAFVSAAIKTAILGAPALFGIRRGAVTRKSAKPTPRQEVAATAAEEGYVTPPSVRGEAGAAGLAEGLGGKIKTGQQAIETNQAVTNNLASRAVGLPEGVPVTIDVLQGIRSQAGQAYEAVRGVGRVFTDNRFQRDLSAAVGRFKNAARDFPALAKSEIIDIVDGLRVAEFDAGAGVDAISLLRNRADVAFRQGDKALGNSYRAASDAVEGVLERHLGRGGDPALVDAFRQSRQQIAETYSVQEALQGRITGEVSATQLAAQLKKGKPLSGDLRAIADFANTFPTVSKLFTGTAQAFSPLDLAVGGTSVGIGGTALALGAGPAALIPLAGTVARPLLRRGALSDVARRSGFGRESIRPTDAVKAGGVLGAVLADE